MKNGYDFLFNASTSTDANVKTFIPYKINNNKYNDIQRCDEYIIKRGPEDILKGELFYYQNIPEEIVKYFPILYAYNTGINRIDFAIDYIDGIPLYHLYKGTLITHRHIDDLFDILDILHSCEAEIIITRENVKNNYVKKLNNRFNRHDYYFEDAEDVFLDIIADIETHFSPVLSPVIHGDFWFSNIILSQEAHNDNDNDNDNDKNNYTLIDMKGIVDCVLTLNGDIYYDYGKLYQSILGYDLILNNDDINRKTKEYIQSISRYFLDKCHKKGLNTKYLKCVTKSLVFGTIPFITHLDASIKNNVWGFIKTIEIN
jgi:hypothetical protein